MATEAYKEIENIFPRIIKLMPETFDSHDFILTLAQKYQKLYIQVLYEFRDSKRPFHRVHMGIAKRLKKRSDLVAHIDNHFSEDIFGGNNEVAVWRKVK
jgi:hypothetical protein